MQNIIINYILLTYMMCVSDVKYVGRVYVVIEGLLHQLLGLITGQLSHPGVEEDELQVEAGPVHEHVAVQTHLRDGAGWKRVPHGDQAYRLVAVGVNSGRHLDSVLSNLEVAATVDHLVTVICY